MSSVSAKLAFLLLAFYAVTSASVTAVVPADRFSRYPSPVQETARHGAPVLNTPWSRHFAADLIRAARSPIDFAGHYVLITESCGAECLTVGAIDVRSGRVVELRRTICCWPVDVDRPIRYLPGSRLLITYGQLQEAGGAGPHHFVLQKSRFVPLYAR